MDSCHRIFFTLVKGRLETSSKTRLYVQQRAYNAAVGKSKTTMAGSDCLPVSTSRHFRYFVDCGEVPRSRLAKLDGTGGKNSCVFSLNIRLE